MRTHRHNSVLLGDLVVAVFEAAESYSTDPWKVSRLASQAIAHILDLAQKTARLEGGCSPCRSPPVCS
jgi:hypothetical protein